MLRRHFYILLLLLLSAPSAFASEARVNAAGGLLLIFDDEVYSLTPFTLGNPAGLALIPSTSRFDIKGQYLHENDDSLGTTRGYFGTLGSALDSKVISYNGLILFLDNHWAVQMDADYLYAQGQPAINLDTNGNNRTRELFRTAYNFGFATLGVEVAPTQVFSPIPDQFISPGEVVSGEEHSDAWTLNSGLLASFPENPKPKDERLYVGGLYGFQMTQPVDKFSLNIIPTGFSTTSPVTATFTGTKTQSFGPEVYFDSPGSMQLGLLARFVDFALNLDMESPNGLLVPSPGSFKYEDGSGYELIGVTKMALPLPGTSKLRTGALLTFSSSDFNNYQQGGGIQAEGNQWSWQATTGAGIENPDHFTLGFQASIEQKGGNTFDASGNSLARSGYLDYGFNFGVEKWADAHWALRTGFAYRNEINSGDQTVSTLYWPVIGSGVRLITNTFSAGVGFKDKGFYMDLTGSYGQAKQWNSTYDIFGNQLWGQWALGVSLD
jgi:hypothetical protein